MPGCTKQFSRKDNLQQHMAMVHAQRAIKLEVPGEDGATHRYEAIEDQPKKAGRAAGKPKKAGRKKKAGGDDDDEEDSVEGSAQPEGEDGDAEGEEADAEGENAEAGPSGEAAPAAAAKDAVPVENLDPALSGAAAPGPPTTTETAATAPASNLASNEALAAVDQGFYNSNDFLGQLRAIEETAAILSAQGKANEKRPREEEGVDGEQGAGEAGPSDGKKARTDGGADIPV